MREIKLQYLDELFELSTEIGILTYLQDLVKTNMDESRFNSNGLESFAREALSRLIEQQYELVGKLWALLERQDFPK